MWTLPLYPIFIVSALASNIVLPKPKGQYGVTIRTSELTDTSRVDPFDPNNGYRRVMVSAFSPTRDEDISCKSPYMLNEVSKYFTNYLQKYGNITADLSRFKLPLCSQDVTYGVPSYSKQDDSQKMLPLVIFSPGFHFTRFLYNAICASLASTGFLVLSIDHPYSIDVVQYPDNTTARISHPVADHPDRYYVRHLELRVGDASFILDSLTTNSTLVELLFPTATPNVTQVGFLGHSFGGATAAQAIYEDNRFIGGVNLDGGFYGSVIKHGFSDPFIIWGSDGHNQSTLDTWGELYSRLSGFKRELTFNGSTHYTFTDLVILGDLYPFENDAVLGKIPGRRALKTITAYTRDFFRFVLFGANKGLVKGPNDKYPEVGFI